ncbi:hypothetical protein HYW39_00645, partial [Candidatus Curtissbacteria bacterium]|nr:hypothetical protein [Candidatus Curtissbacteria bacterium]
MARYGGEVAKVIEFCQNVDDTLIERCFIKLAHTAQNWGRGQSEIKIICQAAQNHKSSCLEEFGI